MRLLNPNTRREAKFYAKRIIKYINVMVGYNSNDKLSVIRNRLNSKLRSSNLDIDTLSKLVNNWEDDFKNNYQLQKDELDWIKKDKSASLFVFSIISSQNTLKEINDNKLTPILNENKITSKYAKTRELLEDNLDMLTIISSHEDRCRSIFDCFFNCEESISSQREFIKLLQSLYSHTILIDQNKKLIKWLNKNNQIQILWTLDYLGEKITLNEEFLWNTTNTHDHYLSIVLFFNINFLIDPNESELILRKMKAAWSQKKFRDKSEGSKPYSVSMSKKTKERLTWLVEEDNSNIQQVIKNLIDDAYLNKKNSSN
ncbi:hypothetical protein ACCH75_003167 [Vibrio parahaemolyticus]|nr:hypothetical protein [Vibrio parahaemolyticus]HAS6475986.1 hypothetical protein [Vibrio parahaemolyticus]